MERCGRVWLHVLMHVVVGVSALLCVCHTLASLHVHAFACIILKAIDPNRSSEVVGRTCTNDSASFRLIFIGVYFVVFFPA